jgi:hypothetical protein
MQSLHHFFSVLQCPESMVRIALELRGPASTRPRNFRALESY